MLELRNLSAGYPGRDVLRKIDLKFIPGRVTVLLGPNGCGRSTLLRAACGLLPVSGGEVLPAEETGRKPSLLLRFTEEAESLWDIAKSCKTSTAAIRQSNDLVGDTVPANTLLLIPM